MQVGSAYEGSYYDEEPRSHHHHDQIKARSRSRSRRRSSSRDDSRSSHGEKSLGHKSKGGHKTEKKLAATVAGGALGALAVHQLGGHHDVATVVGGLVGAFAGNKLEKKHEEKKEEKLRRESEGHGSHYGGSEPRYGSSRDLVRDEDGGRRDSRDSRRRSVDYDESSESESDGGRRRRRHHH